MRCEKIWAEQCAAAVDIRERHGVEAAADYLIGEKPPMFAEAAASRPAFARELPSFVGEARQFFLWAEIAAGLARLEAAVARVEHHDDADHDIFDTSEQRAAQRERIEVLRVLLLSEKLGIA
jgi:hypothetical protein